jgi:hypothetical protein
MRRVTLVSRHEVNERGRKKGISEMVMCANMYNDTPR